MTHETPWLVDVQDGICRLTFNRPEVLNAQDPVVARATLLVERAR